MSHTTIVGLCTVELYLPGLGSLKAKRSVIKPLLARLRKTFNISVAEVGHLDVWQSAAIAFVVVTNQSVHASQTIDNVLKWLETNYPDLYVTNHEIEIL
jgi:hypothetical protein